MKKFLFALMILFAVNFSLASAEIITVEGDGRYVADKMLDETIRACTEHARDAALLDAANNAGGVLVKNYALMIDHELTEDVVETFLVSQLEGVKYSGEDFRKNSEGDTEFVCRVTATVDTSKIDLEKFLKRDDFSEKERLTRELREARAEIERLKAQSQTGNDAQRQKFQNEFDRKQNQFLIAKYERDLDIYDFGKKINLQDMMATAEKLAALDADNVSAFRAKVFVYRQDEEPNRFYNYCYEISQTSHSPELLIEAYLQMGDYDFVCRKTERAREYVDKAIALVKKNYTPIQIEDLVNGTNVQIVDYELVGRSNTIRELYILKSEIENCNPSFDCLMWFLDMELDRLKFYNLKYRIDW